MKAKFITILFTLAIFYGYGQNIGKDTRLEAGFYKTIEELGSNKPSKPFNYVITDRPYSVSFLTNDKTTLYNLEITKDSIESIGPIFGFSDGKNVYIKTTRMGLAGVFKGKKFNEKTNYMKADEVGVYIFYYDFHRVKSYQNDQFRSAMNYSYDPHVINTKDNKIFIVSTRVMKNLLKDEPELLKEFKEDRYKKKKFQKYIAEYNKRYAAK